MSLNSNSFTLLGPLHGKRLTANLTYDLCSLCVVLGLNVLSNGFDLSVYNTIQAITSFQQQFGDQCTAANVCTIGTVRLSLLNSVPFITFAFALFVAALIGDHYGRRVVYILMNVICLVGVSVSYTAKSYGQILAGRAIVNIYTGMESWLIPLFLGEVVPAQLRGMLVAGYMLGRLIGTLIISCVSYSTSTWPGDAAWKTPLAVLFSVPAVALLASVFVPESPRWLLLKGREQDALQNLKYLNDGREGFDSMVEMNAIRTNAELHVDKGSWARPIPRQGSRESNQKTRRTVIALLTNFFALSSGQAFSNIYSTIFFKSLGTGNPFIFTIISQCCGLLGSVFFMLLVDKVGRRFFWKTIAPVAALAMLTLGGLGTIAHPTMSQNLGIVAMLCVYSFAFLGSTAQLAALTPAEIPSLRLRGKTAMAAWSVQNLTNFVTTFTVPYLINPGYGDLGAKVGFIYGGFGVMGCVWAYFYYPELKGKSLDEMDLSFDENAALEKTILASKPVATHLEEL